MKRYAVVFEESAQSDVRKSYWAVIACCSRFKRGKFMCSTLEVLMHDEALNKDETFYDERG